VIPYVTLFQSMPSGRGWEEMKQCSISLLNRAVEAGFRAMKMEMLFEDLIDDRELVRFVHECRRIIGEVRELMIDVGYRWKNCNDALWALRRIEDDRLFFVETPLHTDDLDGLARLADATTTPVAAGEFLQTRYEFRELMDRGRADVIQPDVGRVGGLTEAMRCARMAFERGLYCIPHAWKTGLTVAATRHFGAAAPNCPFTEFFARDFFPSFLRSHLAGPEPELKDGRWELPEGPGLGVEMDAEIVERCLTRPVTVIQ